MTTAATVPITAETPLQEVFDFVINHLRKQGKRSIVKTELRDMCAYTNPDGLMCAVGCLLPEGYGGAKGAVNVLAEKHPELLPILGNEGSERRSLLRNLQILHDLSASWTELGIREEEVQEKAETWQLVYTPPKETLW